MMTTREALQKSTKLVDQFLTRDKKYVGIEDLVTEKQQIMENMFVVKKVVSLPDPIVEQYDKLEFKCFTGLFPEIERAWVTIDNKFFIWNYVTGTDFTEYDEIDQVIISVALVKPKPNTFKDYVKYLLVLATSVEVALVAVAFTNNNTEISLLPTGYSAPTDNISMLKISGTSDGRIFMCGQDGHLHEFEYNIDSSWNRRKCRKINHSQATLRQFLPQISKWFGSTSPLIDIAIDNKNMRLYALSEDSNIEIFNISEKKAVKLTPYTSLAADVNYSTRTNWELNDLKLTSLFVIMESESRRLNLVAISTKGDRCFFEMGADSLRLATVRSGQTSLPVSSPNRVFSPTHSAIQQIQEAYYNKGVFILADSRTDTTDTLICISYQRNYSPDINRQGRIWDGLSEIISSRQLSAKTHALAEIQLDLDPVLIPEGNDLNELVTQHVKPPREFICLTYNSLIHLTKYRPVDKLQQLIQQGDEESIHNFFRSYGYDEGCCMCVNLSCNTGSYFVPASTQEFGAPLEIPPQQAATPLQLFIKFGGEPAYQQGIRTQHADHEMGGPISQRDISYSHSHNGVYLYFSRLIRPLWSSPLFSYDTDPTSKNIINIRNKYNEDQLIEIKSSLYALSRFLNKFPKLTIAAEPSQQHARGITHKIYGYMVDGKISGGLVHMKEADDAKRIQERSLAELSEVVNRSIAVVEFMEFLIRYQIPTLMVRTDGDSGAQLLVPQNVLRKLCEEFVFKDYILLPEGEGLLKDLARFSVVHVENYNNLIKDLAHYSTFFTQHDLKEYKAIHALQEVERITDPDRKEQVLYEILHILLEICGHIDITSSVARLRRLKFYSGAVELALVASEQAEASNVDKKRECADCVLNILAELSSQLEPDQRIKQSSAERSRLRSKLLARMLRSRDEEFHRRLYAWYLEKHEDQIFELLRVQNPFLENFLKENKRHNLLATYYDAHGQYDKAAQVMIYASEREGFLQLDDRIAYLSRAVGHAKAAPGMGELLHMLQEKLDIAHVQKKMLSELRESTSINEQEKNIAIQELNAKLLSISELYNNYAIVYNLVESCIIALYCADYKDTALLQDLWQKFFERNSSHALTFETKLISLGRELKATRPFFPLEYIIAYLESLNMAMNHWAIGILRNAGVRYSDLYAAYRKIYGLLFTSDETSEDPYRPIIASLLPQNKRLRLILVYNMVYTLVEWTEHLKSPNAPVADQSAFPAATIQHHIAEYDSLMNQFDQQEVQLIKKNLRQLKNNLN